MVLFFIRFSFVQPPGRAFFLPAEIPALKPTEPTFDRSLCTIRTTVHSFRNSNTPLPGIDIARPLIDQRGTYERDETTESKRKRTNKRCCCNYPLLAGSLRMQTRDGVTCNMYR